jgi:16S rRNA (cytosine1402-N4)-methyltransferase
LGNDDGLYHIPVLGERSVEVLLTRTDGVYVDGTLGGGGHSALLLSRLNRDGRILGIDQDAEAISFSNERFRNDERMIVVKNNVVHLRPILQFHRIDRIDGILLDLGMSSRQIDHAGRGFSFQHDGPLDMRMDTDTPHTAADLLMHATRDELARIFRVYGEERFSGRIAAAIVDARQRGAIERTSQLREIIARCIPPPHASKTMARIFQSLRIAVNRELDVLEETLAAAHELLAVGGRMAVISYHSLEDRIVKQYLRARAVSCVCPPRTPVCVCGTIPTMKVLTHKAIQPDEDEIRRNPRARSARLRAGEKIHA